MRNREFFSQRMLCTWTVLSLLTLGIALPHASAQSAPPVVEFLPSAEHEQSQNGKPVVSRYELVVYRAGAHEPYLRINLGKPARQADGMIRVNLAQAVPVWPLSNTPSEARIVAHGPGGTGVSVAAGAFVYECPVALSSAGESVAAAGGTHSVQVTADAQCGRTAISTADWITITSGATGSGSGPLTYAVAANSSALSRTATLTIGGRLHMVTQAGAEAEPRALDMQQ
jgi:hypothetical protein